MTKSVIEKQRISKIKELESNGLPIPAELIKISLSFQNKKDKLKKTPNTIRRTFFNRNWTRSKIQKLIELHINPVITDIANDIHLYDFKLFVTFFESPGDISERKRMGIYVYLKDRRNNILGYVCFKEDSKISLFSEPFDPLNKIPNDVFSNFTNTLKNMNSESPCYLNISQKSSNKNSAKNYKYLNHLRHNYYHINRINAFQKEMDEYLLNISIHPHVFNNNKIWIKYSSDNGFKAKFIKVDGPCKTFVFNPSITLDKILFIKMLINLNLVNLDIEENKITLENLPEIENMIKMSNY